MQWPETLTEASYKVFEQFVQLALMQAKSSVQSAGEEKPKPHDEMEKPTEQVGFFFLDIT